MSDRWTCSRCGNDFCGPRRAFCYPCRQEESIRHVEHTCTQCKQAVTFEIHDRVDVFESWMKCLSCGAEFDCLGCLMVSPDNAPEAP